MPSLSELKLPHGLTEATCILWTSERVLFSWIDQVGLSATFGDLVEPYEIIEYGRVFTKDNEYHFWKLSDGVYYHRDWIKDFPSKDDLPELSETHQLMSGTSCTDHSSDKYILLKEDRGVAWKIPYDCLPKTTDKDSLISQINTGKGKIRLKLNIEGVYLPNSTGIYSLYDYRYKSIDVYPE